MEAAEYYKLKDSHNHRRLDSRLLCYTQDTLKFFLEWNTAFEIAPPWKYLMTKLHTTSYAIVILAANFK